MFPRNDLATQRKTNLEHGGCSGQKNSACAEVQQEDFDEMENVGTREETAEMWTSPALERPECSESLPSTLKRHQRALHFEEGKYSLLESELKALYCAVTRARINVWFCDFDKEKRDPVFR
jgi:hypothetical protein